MLGFALCSVYGNSPGGKCKRNLLYVLKAAPLFVNMLSRRDFMYISQREAASSTNRRPAVKSKQDSTRRLSLKIFSHILFFQVCAVLSHVCSYLLAKDRSPRVCKSSTLLCSVFEHLLCNLGICEDI